MGEIRAPVVVVQSFWVTRTWRRVSGQIAGGTAMSDLDAIDFFRDQSVVADPYPYLKGLRDECPVRRETHHDVVMVTGYDEAVQVYNDTEVFSSCTSVTGPFPGFPVPLEGDDVSAVIDQHRDELPFSDQITTMDPPKHTDHRALLMRLITPKRLKENEDFMWRLADLQLDAYFESDGEFVNGFGQPFAMLVIADLLGVPGVRPRPFRRHAPPRRRAHAATSAARATTRSRTARSSTSTPSSRGSSRTGGASRARTC